MKKFFITALLATGASFILPSCNNGAYDADPTSSTGALNPLDPAISGVKIYLGTMVATLNNTKTSFYPAFYVKPGDDAYSIVGERANDPVLHHTIHMDITGFKNLSEFGSHFYYTYVDTTVDTMRLFTYEGDIKIVMNGNESGNLRGWFYGEMHRKTPVENPADIIKIEDGEFYVPEKK